MNDVDILKVAIDGVKQVVGPTVWVADRLPPDIELAKRLPCVVIDLLPGGEVAPWGGDTGWPIQQLIALDIDVFGRSRMESTPLGEQVRAALHQLPFQAENPVTSVDCPRFSTREDMNPHVKVIGVVCDLTVTG